MMYRSYSLALALTVVGCAHQPAPMPAAAPMPAISAPPAAPQYLLASRAVYGDWQLLTPPDSTAFHGAREVQLTLGPAAFTITANYPAAAPMIVTGEASIANNGGPLTLTPRLCTRNGENISPPQSLPLGVPVTVLAGAAGQTMVFSVPGLTSHFTPTSVWQRSNGLVSSEAAGSITPPR
jgi:hypothetical protein